MSDSILDEMDRPGNKIAIVTGANSGLGKEFVRLLAADDRLDEIWAIARNQEGLERLREIAGEKLRIFSMDLSDVRTIENFAIVLKKHLPHVVFLVNNAGFAKFGSYDDLDIRESLNMIQLNCCAVVALGLVSIPYMKAGDHILNIASVASFQPLPYQNIYSSTKAFVRNYSRALNVELRDKGISVTAVCPGWIKTNLYARADIGASKATRKFAGMVMPGKVASKALKDAQRGKDVSVYGFYAKLVHIISRLFSQRMMMKIWLRQQHM